ncbi:hypothetical protein BSKO_01175 [Bryopsis sp. KO-2023]|nr:hypothetical protein BSKO_01175 [Bryopsis sp. KO-2023]
MDTASNITPNGSEGDGGGGEAHSREEAMLRELWDASREESPPPAPIPLRAQRSDSSLAEKIRFLAEASWTSEVDFMDLPGQNTIDLTNEMQNLQDSDCSGATHGISSPHVPVVSSGWPPNAHIAHETGGNGGLFPGNELDPFAGLPYSKPPRENGSTTLPPLPPLFTSAAPCTPMSTEIPSKLFDFIAPHLPTDTDLSSLMNTDAFPDQTRGLAPLSIPGEAMGGVPGSSHLAGQAPVSAPGVLNGLTAGHEPIVDQSQLSAQVQDQGMNMTMQRPVALPGQAPENLIPLQYQMSVPGRHQGVTSQMTSFRQPISASPCSEAVHGQTVSFDRRAPGNCVTGMDKSYGHTQQTQQLYSPMQQGSYGNLAQGGVWGSDTRRISVRQDYPRGNIGNIEKMVQNSLKPMLGSDTKVGAVGFSPSGSIHHIHQSDYGFAQEEEAWSPSPSQTVGYLPSETHRSWSSHSCGVQLEPSLVPSSQPRVVQMAQSYSGPILGTVISKSIRTFPGHHSPSPEPQFRGPYRHHQGAVVGTSVMDQLEVLDIESSMSSGSTGTSTSSGHRVHRGSKSLEDADDGAVLCPKKVVRKNTEGEGCPAQTETSETPRKSGMSYTGGDDAMAIDSEALQNDTSVEDYLTVLRTAKGSQKTLQTLMPCSAPGPVDPALEQAIKKCDFDLRVSRAEKKMEEHNESMRRIDQMMASGQMSREEAKSRRRQAYNRREAAASRARKDNELRDIVREKERLEKVEKHLRELIVSGPPQMTKKKPVLRRQNSAGACGPGRSTPFNWKQFVASKPAEIVDLTT